MNLLNQKIPTRLMMLYKMVLIYDTYEENVDGFV